MLEQKTIKEDADMRAVLAATDRMILAFSSHDKQNYFAAFAEQASFYFHNLDRLLTSRAEYETEWES